MTQLNACLASGCAPLQALVLPHVAVVGDVAVWISVAYGAVGKLEEERFKDGETPDVLVAPNLSGDSQPPWLAPGSPGTQRSVVCPSWHSRRGKQSLSNCWR